MGKNQLRRARKKALKLQTQVDENLSPSIPKAASTELQTTVPPDFTDPLWQMYKDVVDKFDEPEDEKSALKERPKPEIYFDDDNEIPDEEEKESSLSKRKRKELNKLSVAELKAM
ncbi:hypothetical protein ASPNIDRAFT_43064, partial [Aspergillus niger ATCC 1015]